MNQLPATTEPRKSLMHFNDFETAFKWATMISKSKFCPAGFANSPENILIAIQMGYELGFEPMQALQNIAVINGKPCVYGDGLMALCKTKSDFEYCNEWFDKLNMTAYCEVKRVGEKKHLKSFSQEDAVKANLWDKTGPWKQYPERMLQMRARGFALRDVFAHHLRGIISKEEAQDYTIQTQNKKEQAPIQAQVITVEKEELISDQQLVLLKQKIAEAKVDESLFSQYCKVPCLEMMPLKKFDLALEKLERKIKELKSQEKIDETAVEDESDFWEDYDKEDDSTGTHG